MGFCYFFTISIIIFNLCFNECTTVTYNNADLTNHKIQSNQSRKVNEYIIIPNQDTVRSNLTNVVRSNDTNHRYRIMKSGLNKLTTKNMKTLFPIKKKNSLYTVAVFKNEKPKEVPLKTLAVFEPNANSNAVVLSNPLQIDLPPDQFIIPEVDEDTREGEVFLNDIAFENFISVGENADTYEVDQSLHQEYHNDINSFSANDSYFPDSSYDQLNQAQYEGNFNGYPESHQLTSTTEHSGYFYGYSYQPPSYLPPEENGDGVLHESSGAGLVTSNDTKVVNYEGHDLFSHYYIGYKFWYVALLFGIYHVIMVIFFFLTVLSKHYSRFPAALQAAAGNSYGS